MNKKAINIYFYLRHESKIGRKEQINARLRLDGESRSMGSTGLYVTPSIFSGGEVKGKSREALKLREDLFAFTCSINFLYEKICNRPNFSLKLLCDMYKNKDSDISNMRGLFAEFLKERQGKVGSLLQSRTYRKYELLESNFFQFLSLRYAEVDMKIRNVNSEILGAFHSFLLKELCYEKTTAYRKMKHLKSVFIFAKNRCYISANPFENYVLHQEMGERPFLTERELILLNECVPDTECLERVRDLFMFACFTGLSYIDLKTLCLNDIKTIDGRKWIIKRRAKTRTAFQIPLFDYPISIIEKYTGDGICRNPEDPLFAVISNQKMNLYLKDVADAAGLRKNLTFHVARHTFATLTLGKGVSIESVSSMLGHTSIRTTQIYAKITDCKIAREMHGFCSEMRTNFKPL